MTENKIIETDIIIIGAGPVGLFTVFEAGLLKLRCHLIDVLAEPGGQLTEIYPKKPIYDIPGFPSVLAGDLIHNLMEQAAPFKPGFTLGERAETIEQTAEGHFLVTTHLGTIHKAPNIAIAGGLGCFEPRKPPIQNLADFENQGVEYIVKDPEKFRNKRVVIAGGGDSALDWTIFLKDIANEITMIHRRTQFRGHLDSVQKVMDMAANNEIHLLVNSEVTHLEGAENQTGLKRVGITTDEKEEITWVDCDYFLPLDRKSTRLNSSHIPLSRMPSSA